MTRAKASRPDETDIADPTRCVRIWGPPVEFGWCATHEAEFGLGQDCPHTGLNNKPAPTGFMEDSR